MTKSFLLLILMFVLVGSSFVPSSVSAQDNIYTVLAPLPGTTLPGDDTKADLTSYIPGVFNLIIGLASVIAVAYIIFGGFQYITTDAIMGKEEGKKHIQHAIYGLFMICIAWLILYTINPRILTFDLNIGALSVPSGGGGTLETNPCSDANSTACRMERETLQRLGAGITLNSPCTATSCRTQVAGLTDPSINQLRAMRTACGCSLVITGGSEQANRSSQSDHLRGIAVDLRASPQLNTYLGVANPVAGRTYDVTINGRRTSALYEEVGTTVGGSTSTGRHWHVTLPQQ